MTTETVPEPAPPSGKPALLERMIAGAIRFRWAVLSVVLLLCAIGVWSFQRLPIDATPDITNVQVQINTSAPGFRSEEHTSELQSLMRISYAVFCLKTKKQMAV